MHISKKGCLQSYYSKTGNYNFMFYYPEWQFYNYICYLCMGSSGEYILDFPRSALFHVLLLTNSYHSLIVLHVKLHAAMFLRELASCYALSERTKIYPATLIKKEVCFNLPLWNRWMLFFETI